MEGRGSRLIGVLHLGEPILHAIEHLQRLVFKILSMVLRLAPIGAFGMLLRVGSGVSIFKLVRCLSREYLLIFATSSESALPRLIAKMEHLGVQQAAASSNAEASLRRSLHLAAGSPPTLRLSPFASRLCYARLSAAGVFFTMADPRLACSFRAVCNTVSGVGGSEANGQGV